MQQRHLFASLEQLPGQLPAPGGRQLPLMPWKLHGSCTHRAGQHVGDAFADVVVHAAVQRLVGRPRQRPLLELHAEPAALDAPGGAGSCKGAGEAADRAGGGREWRAA